MALCYQLLSLAVLPLHPPLTTLLPYLMSIIFLVLPLALFLLVSLLTLD